MKILVSIDTSTQLLSSEADIAEALATVLNRAEHPIRKIVVTIRYAAISRDEFNYLCRITAHLHSGEVLTASTHHQVPLHAAKEAGDKMNEAIGKLLSQKRLRKKEPYVKGTANDVAERSYRKLHDGH